MVVECTKIHVVKEVDQTFCVRTQVNLNKSMNEVCHSFTQGCHVIIDGIHVHPSVNLSLVLLRGLAKLVHGTYTAYEAFAVSPQNPCGDSQFTRGAPFRTRGGLELLVAGTVV